MLALGKVEEVPPLDDDVVVDEQLASETVIVVAVGQAQHQVPAALARKQARRTVDESLLGDTLVRLKPLEDPGLDRAARRIRWEDIGPGCRTPALEAGEKAGWIKTLTLVNK